MSTARIPDGTPRPRLLDLFCGAGGAAMGYHRAGFDVVGVDNRPQPRYPFTFVQADAMTFPLDGFDAIHASPPCQKFSQMSAAWRGRGGVTDDLPDLLTPTRARLKAAGVPYVIENVRGAKHHMQATIIIHGGMFDELDVDRLRLFESSHFILTPPMPRRKRPLGIYGDPRPSGVLWRQNGDMKGKRSSTRMPRDLAEGSAAMGIDWMTWPELREAIPPAYTEFIGRQLMDVVEEAIIHRSIVRMLA